ncbi:hemicentin-2-like [Salvelinus alpinus]|uniref:hemicentin-2-like n=1 Tax=Salvelinus alpinus TaxID=8036 RepID=UPI0039FD5CBF
MACTLPLAFLVLHGFLFLSADSCDYYFQPGTDFSIPLNYNELSSKEITWKHNGNVIFKRKNGKFKPGKAEDILDDGSLQLKGLALANEGPYTAEVFNSEGTSIKEQSFRLCMKEKVSKPSVKFTCSAKDVTFTCTLTNTEGVTFKWSQNGLPLNGETKTTFIIDLKQLKELDTFTCSAVNEVSMEKSDPIKPTCNDSCDYYFQPGTDFSIPLNYNELSSKEITWKHNGNVIFKRKNGKFKPGKAEDILDDGSLQLKGLALANEGPYTAEVFNSEGTSIKEQSFRLCMKEKVSKPSVKFTCSAKDVTFTCTLTNTEGVTFKWSQNGQPLNGETKTTFIIDLKQLKELDTFTCSAVNEVSMEKSDPIKPTCNDPCDYYFQPGTDFTIPLNYNELRSKEITWKHNGNVIFKRKNGMFKPGKAEDILDDGSLQLKGLALANEGTYKAEVFNSDGTSIQEQSFRLCMKEKVSKPSVKFTCSAKDVTFTCTLTNTEGVTFKWSQNRQPLNGETKTTFIIDLKQLKELDTFTCSAVNEVSMEKSDPIKPTCNDSCDYYFQPGTDFTIPLNYNELSSKEITWKHNGNVIFKRKNGMFKPGKTEDILDDGSLQLKGLALANEGTYKAEMFNSDGTSIKEQSFRLCMKEKVSKPSVKFTCSAKDVTFTCTLTNTEGVTFKWSQNGQPLNGETKTTFIIDLKQLKEQDTFTCSAFNEVSMEKSDPIKPTCNDSCDYYFQPGTDFSIPLKYTDLSSKEITWKHNGNVIFKRKNGMFKPGKAEDILNDGSLQLKGLALANEGPYTAEVFNSDGTSIKEQSFRLCMKEKVSKPSVKFTCSAKDVTFTCTLTNTEGVTFKWSQNGQPLNGETKTTFIIDLKQLKEQDTFTCSAFNEVSMETSDPIKPTCNDSCDYYFQPGTDFSIPLKYTDLSSKEITWKHNGNVIFKRKNGMFKPGKAEDILNDGSLQLKGLALANEGPYTAEVFNSDGTSIKEQSFRLCMKEKVSKPSVKFTCSAKDVTFTCTLTNTEGVTFKWSQNGQPLNGETKTTFIIDLKQLKEQDTFTCSAFNEVSMETSDPIKPTCNDSCDYYFQPGTDFSIPLKYTDLSSKEITWKHNGNVIFKRKNGMFKPGKAEDILNDGSLQLKGLALANEGPYTAEVFNSDGTSIKEQSFRLCMKEKVSKPSVKFTCSAKDVTFTCTLTNTEGVTFKWSQNGQPLNGETKTTFIIDLKQLKEQDTFTCSAFNEVSMETSDPIKPTCNDSCDYYFQPGTDFSIPLKYTDLSSKEITWKHNGNVIFKRKNGMFKPGKAEDILDDGSLQLKGLALANEGTYTAEVFNSDGTSIKEQSFRLCMKEKVSKPSVKFTCSAKDVTFTCTLTNTEGVTFKWSQNGQPLNGETKTTFIIDLKQLKEQDTFTCSAFNEVSMEKSDPIKPTCNDSCDYYFQPGTDFSIPLKYTDLSSKEITWKHNGNVILERKNGMFKPGKAEDILNDGSLQLKGLALANEGPYTAEVFNSDGTSIKEQSFRLCMKEKVSKPSVKFTCSAKDVTFTCTLTNTEGVTFKWSQNGQPLNGETKTTFIIDLKQLKEQDTFTCSAFNEVSMETSDPIKPTCNDSCDYYFQPGTDFSIPLKYTDLSSKEITWKHNGNVILERKNGMFKPGKAEDILNDGSLQLKGLALANEGPYTAEVFNSDGTSIKEQSFRLCMKEKVSKPSVKFTCSAKDVTFTCTLTNTEGVTFKWSQNGQPLNGETKTTFIIDLKQLKEQDTFTCSAFNEVSMETSDPIKPTCNDSCDYYFQPGTDFSIPLKYTDLSSKEITWKHNGNVIFKRKNGMFKPGKTEDILDDGSLQLKGLALANEGTYKAEMFNSDGTSIKEQSFRLCMKEKVSKPSVKFTCSAKDVTFTCTLTNTEGVTFKWSQNGQPLNGETKTTFIIDLKQLKEQDTFTCSAFNEVSMETSDPIKPTCNDPCDYYFQPGTDFTIPLNYNELSSKEITWKHNGNVILKRKNGMFKPGKAEDILDDGSLQLKGLALANEGPYTAEVFNSDGTSIKEQSFRLCMKEKVSKPSVKFTCSAKDVTFTCTLTNTEGVTFKWSQNGQPLNGETKTTFIIDLKQLKEQDTFTCSAFNEVSMEKSDPIKPTCNDHGGHPDRGRGLGTPPHHHHLGVLLPQPTQELDAL